MNEMYKIVDRRHSVFLRHENKPSRSEPQDDADFLMNEKSSMTCV